jgi:hypothetical protein
MRRDICNAWVGDGKKEMCCDFLLACHMVDGQAAAAAAGWCWVKHAMG